MSDIGLRREDKNRWERRVPLIPSHVKELLKENRISISLQPSPNRIFTDEDYRQVGAMVEEDISSCPVVIAVKEIPASFFREKKVYLFFSHTVKGQPDNMPMLKTMMKLGCTLIDYEKIVDDQGRRLVLFGRQAGQAGIIETLWAYGQRMSEKGLVTPFSSLRRAYEYSSLVEAKESFAQVGWAIQQQGIDHGVLPFVCGFAGYGSVSQGAQELFDLLPHTQISPEDLYSLSPLAPVSNRLYKVVFEEKHMVEPVSPENFFMLQDYYDFPEKYTSVFADYLSELSVLVNGIYWTPRYPRLVTIQALKDLWDSASEPRLQVIGDISCDIGGSIECTVKATNPDDPVFVYDPIEERISDGFKGRGVVVMAVDNLPAEIALESSVFFSQSLKPWIPALARADFSGDFESCSLPPELKGAVILYHGELTPNFKYMEKYLDSEEALS